MRPSIFISRSTLRSKAFIDKVQKVSSSIICESLIEFTLIKSTSLPEQGWLFFYSQTGVDFFLKQHHIKEVISKGLMIAAFGPKTGEYMAGQGLTIDFIGTGESESTAIQFLSLDNLSDVCFVKGSNSKDSLQPLLEEYCNISSIEVYHNQGKTSLDIPTSDILVFTSPLNLETYFSSYPLLPYQKIITIGISTATSALDASVDEVHIASQPSLESLAESVIRVCETWEGPE